MKKIFFISIFIIFIFTSFVSSQIIPEVNSLKDIKTEKKQFLKNAGAPTSGASGGFNLGFGSVEGSVVFAIGAFAEIKAGDVSFVPQANYWNGDGQSDFELAGLARFFLSKKLVMPYLDGGLGVNFYNSDNADFTKLSILVGGGVELANLGTSFSLLLDGKYKLIINDPGNLSCFIFTAGMKFPFK